jgi:hypothetical protein
MMNGGEELARLEDDAERSVPRPADSRVTPGGER